MCIQDICNIRMAKDWRGEAQRALRNLYVLVWMEEHCGVSLLHCLSWLTPPGTRLWCNVGEGSSLLSRQKTSQLPFAIGEQAVPCGQFINVLLQYFAITMTNSLPILDNWCADSLVWQHMPCWQSTSILKGYFSDRFPWLFCLGIMVFFQFM